MIDEIILQALSESLAEQQQLLKNYTAIITKAEKELAEATAKAEPTRTKVKELEAYIRENYGDEFV